MTTLPFIADGQKLSKADIRSFTGLVSGNSELQCKFKFDDSWLGISKIVEFVGKNGNDYANVRNDLVVVPAKISNSKHFKLKVYGAKNKKILFSTNYVLVEQR